MRLTTEVVEETFASCLDNLGDVEAEGVVEAVTFNKRTLDTHTELITSLLAELPDEFKLSGGGGWSFLNACNDRHGNQWTSFHRTMDRLFMLGQAIGMVTCQLPRDMWDALPGGMPYYIVNDKQVGT